MIGIYDNDNVYWLPVGEAAACFGVSRETLKKKLSTVGMVRGTIECVYNKKYSRTEWAVNSNRLQLVSQLINTPLSDSVPKYLLNRSNFTLASKRSVKQR
ncbi:MAG: hypothetical protein MJ187_03000 [Alphaproteobacteria bacterium]|nr:hypothetical protein [Alphaproteobacteria bacterium]